jgi:CPA2 family monovalent cation:H+ antiporter-2
VHDPGLLGEILLLIAIAAVGVALFERLGLPAIAGFLVMGALVGPGGLGWVADPARVQSLAEFGVVFLLFEIGLELPVDRLRRMWRGAILGGAVQVGVTAAAAAALAWQLGVPPRAALVLGFLVAMSSTALLLRLLTDRHEIDAPQGQLSVGILLFQDLCIVPILLLLPILAAEAPGAAQQAALSLAGSVVALGALFLVARFVLPRALDLAARLGSRDLFSLLAFLVVMGSAVAAEGIGLTLAVGAFLGGLLLSASPYAHQLFAEVVPLRGVLLGIFFTAVGMLFDPGAAVENWPAVLGYLAGVLVLKALVVAATVRLVLSQGLRLGIITGLGLAQTGEFSFVLAAAASGLGLLDKQLEQIFVAGSIGTLILTPFLIRGAPGLASLVARGPEPFTRPAPDRAEGLSGHAVLIGFGVAGQQLARVLRAQRIEYVAVDANASSVRAIRARGEPVLYGDATRPEILNRLSIARARLVVVAVSDPLASKLIVAAVRRLSSQATIAVRTRYVEEVDELDALGADAVVAEEFESTIELLTVGLRALGAPAGGIARFTEELREEGYSPMRSPAAMILDPWLSELLEQVSTEWIEVPETRSDQASLGELGIRARSGASVLAVDRGGRTISNPDSSFRLEAGDRLLAFGTPAALVRLRELLAGGDGDPSAG